MIQVGAATDVGRVRKANEDALLTLALPGLMLVAVADGMGGHAAGEVASAIAVQTLAEAVQVAGDLLTEPETVLRRSVEQANSAVWQAAAADASLDGMGTTLVAALVDADGRGVVANVGDSRAYLVSDRGAQLLTQDHTWVTEQVRAGELTRREARASPLRNVLTRSVGSAPQVAVDLFEAVQLAPHTALVLCSDGVTEYVDEADLAGVLREARDSQDAAERLVRLAVKRGGADNATVVVARRI